MGLRVNTNATVAPYTPTPGYPPGSAQDPANPNGYNYTGNPIGMNPRANTVGGRTGIAAYNGIELPTYQNPYDIGEFTGSKYYGIATGESMSPWSRLAVEQQNKLAANKNAAAKANAQGIAAKTASSLAQQGGLTSGARERAEEQAGKNVLSMVQGNNQGAAENIGNIGIEDAKQRLAMLGDATSKLTSMKASNITGTNQYNQNITDMLNKAVSANETAKAQRAAAEAQGGGICLIIAASSSLLGPMNMSEARAAEKVNPELQKIVEATREVRKTATARQLRGYYRVSEALVPKIENSMLAKKIVYHAMVKPIVKNSFMSRIWGYVFGTFGGKKVVRSNGEIV